MHFTTDKSARVTDLTIWRAGFAEERQVLVSVLWSVGAEVETQIGRAHV